MSLGCHLSGYALPHLDPYDPYTTVAGVCKRFCCKPPVPVANVLKQLKKFVESYCKENFVPLAPDTDLSIENWLLHTDYPEWRKSEIRNSWDKVGNILEDKRYRKCKSFMKDEFYGDYKHARAINARCDEFKAYLGPIFKQIERVVYSHKEFIKHIPVADRPNYIYEYLYGENRQYYETDYTAFESLFTAELMKACEFVLYDYMTQYLPIHGEFMEVLNNVIAGENICEFKYFWVKVMATRMSGEMNTSLGNGFSNLMFMKFACFLKGSTCEGVVEGDDGLFVISGPPPTAKDFEELGLRIKLVVHNKISTAAFCQIIFDEVDRRNVVDPFKTLMKFGWGKATYVKSKSKKLRALLRCKALSLAVQYPGCPIIQSLAQYGIRMTSDVDFYTLLKTISAKTFSSYERSKYMDAISATDFSPKPIGVRTRMLVEECYGISISSQLDYEKYLDGLQVLAPLDPRSVDISASNVYRDYFESYYFEMVGDSLYYPPIENRKAYVWDEVSDIISKHQLKRP